MTTHDVLRKARAYLLEHGWHQGGWGCGERRCAYGALKEADGGLGLGSHSEPVWDAWKVLRDTVNDMDVAQWNDTPGRTFDEVIAAFDKAIAATAPPLDDTPIFQALEDLPADQYIEALSVLALIPAEAIGA